MQENFSDLWLVLGDIAGNKKCYAIKSIVFVQFSPYTHTGFKLIIFTIRRVLPAQIARWRDSARTKFGIVENFLLNDILGIKKYFLENAIAERLEAIKQ